MLVISQLYSTKFSLCKESQEEWRSCICSEIEGRYKPACISRPRDDSPRHWGHTQRERFSTCAGKKGSAARKELAFPVYTKSEILSILGNWDNKSKPESSPVSQAGLVPLPSKTAQPVALIVILWESNKQCFQKADYVLQRLYANILASYLTQVVSGSSLKTYLEVNRVLHHSIVHYQYMKFKMKSVDVFTCNWVQKLALKCAWKSEISLGVR